MARKDLLSRLADAGEEAISKLADAPGGDRLLGAVSSMRDRVDELQRKVRGLDELERRVAALERRLDDKKTRKATTPKPKRASTAKARRKPAASSTRKTGSGSPG